MANTLANTLGKTNEIVSPVLIISGKIIAVKTAIGMNLKARRTRVYIRIFSKNMIKDKRDK